MIKSLRAVSVLAAFVAFSGVASASNSAYTFTDNNGGNGYVSGTFPSFTLVSSDNNVGDTLSQYTATFSSAETVTFNWSYTTSDWNGFYDPAGYTLNGVLYQLSDNSAVTGATYTGTATIDVQAGDTFGWYDHSLDSAFGSSALTVNVSVVPEPANMMLLLAGLGALGVVARRRKSA